MNKDSNNVARTLRARGYVPLPRLWVKREELEAILEIAFSHKDEVNKVRAQARIADKKQA